MLLSIEYVTFLVNAIANINSQELGQIRFYEYGSELEIPRSVISDWDFTGLSNIDFITSERYKETQ